MMKNFSASSLMKGIVEEVEISELKLPNYTIHERGTETVDELALSILTIWFVASNCHKNQRKPF